MIQVILLSPIGIQYHSKKFESVPEARAYAEYMLEFKEKDTAEVRVNDETILTLKHS